ncbi:MAG TPA: UDP-4-amino-4,6-dideoxy-N-acetyl-beta-L-altrosamine transaminase, partial [Fibrobacteres bacterium]|nr:UDP-4-amino-4,6-dideoxy-N-acetyl-beta-L-altrosamine transaminase [Fibrobacterota bacterium]
MDGGKPVRSRKNFLVFGAPQIGSEEIAGVVDSLRRRWVGTGPKVSEFEQAFARYKGSSHAVAVNSCTAALHLSILSLGIGPGDEVITTGMTFCATVNAILHAGATPVLADCDPRTLNLDPNQVARKITKRTKAILPVHFAGLPCDMNALMKLAKAH